MVYTELSYPYDRTSTPCNCTSTPCRREVGSAHSWVELHGVDREVPNWIRSHTRTESVSFQSPPPFRVLSEVSPFRVLSESFPPPLKGHTPARGRGTFFHPRCLLRTAAARAPHGHGALSLLYSVVRIVIFRSLADPLVHKPNVWRYVILVVPAEGGSWKSVPVHAKGVFGWR